VDPDPALGPVEEVADALGALVVGVAAAGAELEDLAVGVLEDRAVQVRRLLRRLLAEVAAAGPDPHRVLVLAEPPPRDIELVRALVAGVAVAVVPMPVPVVVEAVAAERPPPSFAPPTRCGRRASRRTRACRPAGPRWWPARASGWAWRR